MKSVMRDPLALGQGMLPPRSMLLGLVILAGWALACRSSPPPPDLEVLATWRGGEIRVADLDAFLLQQPTGQRRPKDGESTGDWLGRQLRLLFRQQQLLREAESLGIEDAAEYLDRWREVRRRAMVRIYLQRHSGPGEVTGEEIQAYFEAHRDTWRAPEKRIFLNLLLAFPDSASARDRDAQCARAEALRQDIIAGASFEELAKEHSDSSNAASGGLVAALARQQLRGEVSDVLFSLASGDVSRVLRNRAGCQLFKVRQIIPAIEPSVELLQGEIAEILIEQRRREWQLELLRVEADRQGVHLEAALDGVDWQTLPVDQVLFELGQERVTPKDLVVGTQAGKSPSEALLDRISDILFVASMEADGGPELAALLEPVKRQFTLEFMGRQGLREHLKTLPDEPLRQFYEVHRSRYTSDPRMEWTLYRWPLGAGDPLDAFAAPSALAATLRSDPEGAEAMWRRMEAAGGADRVALPEMSIRELLARHPELSAALLEEHDEGRVLGPHRSGDTLYVAVVEVYLPPRQLSFLEVRSQLQADFIAERGEVVADDWARQLATRHDLRVYGDHLDRFPRLLLERLRDGDS